MAVEVLVRMAGSMRLGPGADYHFYDKDTKVIWEWAVPQHWQKGPKSKELIEELEAWPEDIPLLPPQWPILRVMGEEETRLQLEGKPPPELKPEDEPGRSRLRTLGHDESGRGYSVGDKAIVAQALASLSDAENAHWTKQGIPEVRAVQGAIERIEQAITGERKWPSWATRTIIDSVGGRSRGDFTAPAADEREPGDETDSPDNEDDYDDDND